MKEEGGLKNTSLHTAKNAKYDEFYTQSSVIDKEMAFYKPYFINKVVYCNCDDPYKSNFVKFFIENFNRLGLKKLICTCWSGEATSLFETKTTQIAYKLVITEVKDYKGMKSFLEANKPISLNGNGDFHSQECVELLKEADIIVTNPPFSLFREFVAQLIQYDKLFIIIGNVNAITYKEIFPLFKQDKIWLGATYRGTGSMWFIVPDDAPFNTAQKVVDGVKYQKVSSTAWFTNLQHNNWHEPLKLTKHYSPDEYPKYENYNGIEVGKVVNIPMDYDGVMGVPITFLDKFCPNQFEIVKFRKGDDNKDLTCTINGVKEYPYFRVLIRRK